MTSCFDVQPNWLLPHKSSECDRPKNHFFGRLLATNDLDQWNEVRGIERMNNDEALRVRAGLLQLRRRHATGAGQDDLVWRDSSVDLCKHARLQIWALRHVFLHEIGSLCSLGSRGDKSNRVHRR